MNLIDVTEATNRVVGGLECRYITCAGQLFRYRSTLLFAQNVRIFWTIIRGVSTFHNFKSGRTSKIKKGFARLFCMNPYHINLRNQVMELHDFLALPLGRGKHVSSAPMHSKFLGQDFLLVVAGNSLLSHPGKKQSCLTNRCWIYYVKYLLSSFMIF